MDASLHDLKILRHYRPKIRERGVDAHQIVDTPLDGVLVLQVRLAIVVRHPDTIDRRIAVSVEQLESDRLGVKCMQTMLTINLVIFRSRVQLLNRRLHI